LTTTTLCSIFFVEKLLLFINYKQFFCFSGKNMKTIAFSIQKGGVGKSSLSVSLAAELAEGGRQVLLIDADPQGSASSWIGPEELNVELADVLNEKASLDEALVPTRIHGVSLLPTAGLGGELNVYVQAFSDQKEWRLKEVIDGTNLLGFTHCLIDLSPAFGPMEKACFGVTDEIITPILADSFAADGLEIFANNLRQFRDGKATTTPIYKKIILNAIDGRIVQHREILEKIKTIPGFTVYEIPVDPAFRKSQAAGISIQEFRKTKPKTRAELRRLAQDVF
jgi:chromosome partitioning protein